MVAEHTPDDAAGFSQYDGAEAGYLSVAQVARRLGCSVSLVQKWRRLGWLPATRLGPPDVPVYGYRPDDVERFATERWNRRRGRPRRTPATTTTAQRAGIETVVPATEAEAPEAAATDPVAADRSEASEQAEPSDEGSAAPLRQSVAPTTPALPASPAAPSQSGPPSLESPPAPSALPAPTAAPFRRPSLEAMPGILEPEPTGRPLVLWDADPRAGGALVLARFRPHELDYARSVAATWAQRYPDLTLGETPPPGGTPHVLAHWRNGRRIPVEPVESRQE